MAPNLSVLMKPVMRDDPIGLQKMVLYDRWAIIRDTKMYRNVGPYYCGLSSEVGVSLLSQVSLYLIYFFLLPTDQCFRHYIANASEANNFFHRFAITINNLPGVCKKSKILNPIP